MPRKGLTSMPVKRDEWHVDRSIPVVWLFGLLGVMLVQVAIASWYGSSFNSRLAAVEAAQITIAPNTERLTRVEERLTAVGAGVSRIEARLADPVSRR